MRIVEPKVFVLASTAIEDPGLHAYLDYMMGDGGKAAAELLLESGSESSAETLIEIAGRACYRSFAPGLNPNVMKVRTGNKAYIGNLLKQLHGSVLEHATVTFAFVDVSRVFTHELVRHRSGTAVSQESMRYVRLDHIPFAQSDALAEGYADSVTCNSVKDYELSLKQLAMHWDLDNKPFAEKKRLTSAMRRLAPIGTATSIIWTCNLRELRHVITLRTAAGAEEEIRKVFRVVADIAKDLYPAVFQDFEERADGSWEPKYWKV